MKKIIMLIIVLLLSISLVNALGIRPARTSLAFEETPQYGGTLWVVNNDGREFAVKVYVEGELGRYVEIETDELHFRKDQNAKPISFNIDLPNTVPPGISTAEIVVEETFEEDNVNLVSSRIILRHKISVQGPYPDKFVDAKLNFHDQGDNIEFVSEVENLGKKNIQEVKTTFYVNDKEQNQRVLDTASMPLDKGNNTLLKAKLDKNMLERGEFEVSAITSYDGEEVELVRNLRVGIPEVEISYFEQYFIADSVNPYSLELYNKWNKKIENVHVDVTVRKDDQELESFRTRSVPIDGLMREVIQSFYDATGKQAGEYVFDMVVNFWNTYKMDSQEFNVTFVQKGEDIELLKEEQEPSSNTFVVISIILAGVIVIIVVMLLLFFLKSRKKEEDI